jgi:hypothetical protein
MRPPLHGPSWVEGAREGNYFPGIREEENWPCEKALGISYLEFSRER